MGFITVAGHICVDLTPTDLRSTRIRPGELSGCGPLQMRVGGAVGNTLRNLRALGVRARGHAAVGTDVLGRVVRDTLANQPGETDVVNLLPGSTSYSVVVEALGSDRAFWHHVGVNAAFTGTAIDLDDVDVLHLGYPSLLPALTAHAGAALAELLSRARRAGATTSIDLATIDADSDAARVDWAQIFAAVLPHTDIITPSVDDLVSAYRLSPGGDAGRASRLADMLVQQGAAVAAVSNGAQGLYIRTASEQRLRAAGRALGLVAADWADTAVHVPAEPVNAVRSTNGAGDACTAGFLAALVAGHRVEMAGRIAVACAAAAITGESLGDAVNAVTGPLVPATRPVTLPTNQPPDRFYAGGARITQFRGGGDTRPRTPEDWVGSTVSVRGCSPIGHTRLEDGRLLGRAIAHDPVGWLGGAHPAAWGDDPKILVKLLDAGQRLPVHAHPHTSFARHRLGAAHGKAEAWYILEPGTVHLGLRETLTVEDMHGLVSEQDSDRLLSAMHELHVDRGDRVYVPPGVVHAVGEGVLLAEVQEPEDLSILLEWNGYELNGERDGHLGLGFEIALTALDLTPRSATDIQTLIARAGAGAGSGLPSGADEYFRLERLDVQTRLPLESGFGVLIGIDGHTRLEDPDGSSTDVSEGRTVLLPAGAAPLTLTGPGTVLLIRPPAPPR